MTTEREHLDGHRLRGALIAACDAVQRYCRRDAAARAAEAIRERFGPHGILVAPATHTERHVGNRL